MDTLDTYVPRHMIPLHPYNEQVRKNPQRETWYDLVMVPRAYMRQ